MRLIKSFVTLSLGVGSTILYLFGSSSPLNSLWTAPDAASVNLPLDAIFTAISRSTADVAASLDMDYIIEEFGINYGNTSAEAYEALLLDTYSEFFGNHPSVDISRTLSHLSFLPRDAHVPSHNIYTTDLDEARWFPTEFAQWAKLNPGWTVHDVSEERMDGWLDEIFPPGPSGSIGLVKEMKALKGARGIIRADIFRYLALLLNGGVYSDTDTASVRPIAEWGLKHDIYPLSPLENALPHLFAVMQDEKLLPFSQPHTNSAPTMTVSVELDAVFYKRDWREQTYVRGIQIVQWTIKSDAAHPILLDVLGHALRVAKRVREAEERGEDVDIPEVLDWSGPGAFTDAVNRYLLIRYGIHPNALAGITQATMFGDILVLPQHSFRQEYPEGDQGENGLVWHGYYGRWKPMPEEYSLEEQSPDEQSPDEQSPEEQSPEERSPEEQ